MTCDRDIIVRRRDMMPARVLVLAWLFGGNACECHQRYYFLGMHPTFANSNLLLLQLVSLALRRTIFLQKPLNDSILLSNNITGLLVATSNSNLQPGQRELVTGHQSPLNPTDLLSPTLLDTPIRNTYLFGVILVLDTAFIRSVCRKIAWWLIHQFDEDDAV